MTPICQHPDCDNDATFVVSVVETQGTIMSFDAHVVDGPFHRCDEHALATVPPPFERLGDPSGLYVERLNS